SAGRCSPRAAGRRPPSGSSRKYVRRLGVAGAAWQGRRPAGIPLGFEVVEDAARRRSAAARRRAYLREAPLAGRVELRPTVRTSILALAVCAALTQPAAAATVS